MSWITKLQDVTLEIITGDKKRYTPLWKDAQKNIQYNSEGFNFIGKNGTYVDRKNVQGTQFPVYFIFQGEDHLDVAEEFELSAKDKRPWLINHPFYGSIRVQPLGLEFNNTNYNVTEIRGILWETISEKFPSASTDITTTIVELNNSLLELSQESFADAFNPVVTDIQPSVVGVDVIDKNYEVLENTAALKNLAREATATAVNILSAPDKYILATQALINYPFEIQQSVEFRLTKLKDSLTDLISIFDADLLDANGTAIIGAACVLAVSGDYENRTDVINSIDLLSSTYELLTTNFDSQGYDQNSDVAIQLDLIVNSTLAGLNEIAFNAKQERIQILEKDSNPIVLAHRFNTELETFINQNNLSIDELICVRKGRTLVYYV